MAVLRFNGALSARAAACDEPRSESTVPFGSSARRGIGRSVGERGCGIGYEPGGDEDARWRILPGLAEPFRALGRPSAERSGCSTSSNGRADTGVRERAVLADAAVLR